MAEYTDDELRIQDIVATLSGVKLMQTARILRTVPVVLEFLGYSEAARDMHDLLSDSAHSGEYRAPLHSKPLGPNYRACARAVAVFKETVPDAENYINNIRKLEQDPYYDGLFDDTQEDPDEQATDARAAVVGG